MVAQITAIEMYKEVMNRKTDAGEITEPFFLKVNKELADFLGDGIHQDDRLIWDPRTRELISYTGRER